MLGERGLRFKISFREGAVRVLPTIKSTGLPARLTTAPTSTLDVLPTLLALAGVAVATDELDGVDILPMARGAGGALCGRRIRRRWGDRSDGDAARCALQIPGDPD